MRKKTMLKALVLRPVEVLGLSLVTAITFSSCVGSGDGINEGDPNYWTTSRGQFSYKDEGTTWYFIPNADGTASVTFNGDYPLHMTDPSSATVADTLTYRGDLEIPSIAVNNGHAVSITAIGQEAFCGSTALTSITIPSTIKSIGEGAFVLCKAMKTVNFGDESTLESIGLIAFGQCTSMTSITLPASVRTIEKQAFMNCTKLVTINMNEGLETIGDQAFFDHGAKLVTVTIPSTVKTIGTDVFGGKDATYAANLTTIICKATVPPILAGELVSRPTNKITIKVPAGSKAAYEAAENWSSYTIEEE